MAKTTKITILLTLIGIITLTFLSQTQPTQIGTIKSIQYSTSKTTIYLEDNPAELIIFDKLPLNLEQGDKIKFQGKSDVYKSKEQIIISKLDVVQTKK